MATAVAVPVVVVLLVLIRVLGPGSGEDASGPVAEVSGATPSQRDDGPVEVETPEITPEADAACPALMSQLPLEVVGETSRRVDSDSPYAYAWGDPAQVLICGVPQIDLQPDAFIVQISGLPWFVDTSDPAVNVWTTTDRSVAVQISVPASTDSALVTALGPIIAGAIPAR
ncbi:DUF3515 family protein [Klenkia sp. PcliD-1-E]|uniref:DUF3515 family protein n=1 Tax=Klenkia sp. PcliD-1-E TaxID=2954492 RepID=UPI002097D49F|nr:DUF3515 family protein [Klenkia sp. PcliD-1-E]MCO7220106.1 DUF3515 domain-containing protein [Klenkia sp. PcliD-1-E]